MEVDELLAERKLLCAFAKEKENKKRMAEKKYRRLRRGVFKFP